MLFRRPNRLASAVYRSPNSFSLTICTTGRRPHLVHRLTVGHLQTILMDSAARAGVAIDANCIMPDHVHLLVRSPGVDVRSFLKRFKQASAYWFRNTQRDALWQKSYYDHVLRSDEEIERVAAYILDNPVRRGLCSRWDDYPYSWSRWHPLAKRDL